MPGQIWTFLQKELRARLNAHLHMRILLIYLCQLLVCVFNCGILYYT